MNGLSELPVGGLGALPQKIVVVKINALRLILTQSG